MNKVVYIFDLVGKHSGMHYYDDVFADILTNNGYKVTVLSNYCSDNSKKTFMPCIYNKPKFISLLLIAWIYIKFIYFILTHNSKSIYIFLTYGELYDMPFLILSKIIKNFYVDIHEIYSLRRYSESSKFTKRMIVIYKKYVNKIVYHSDKTYNLLKSIDYKGLMLYVPHFKYMFKKDFDEKKISADIISAFSNNFCTKFLFFGNITKVKGIDIIIDCFNSMSEQNKHKSSLIIAGKNSDNIDFTHLESNSDKNIFIFDRHINDDELNYCYSLSDFVLLPYRKSTQSGIVEMAIYFKKPMILSTIPYFETLLKKFPSFGILTTIENYKNTIESVIENRDKLEFYNQKDCDRNELKEEIKLFIDDFNLSLINNS